MDPRARSTLALLILVPAAAFLGSFVAKWIDGGAGGVDLTSPASTVDRPELQNLLDTVERIEARVQSMQPALAQASRSAEGESIEDSLSQVRAVLEDLQSLSRVSTATIPTETNVEALAEALRSRDTSEAERSLSVLTPAELRRRLGVPTRISAGTFSGLGEGTMWSYYRNGKNGDAGFVEVIFIGGAIARVTVGHE